MLIDRTPSESAMPPRHLLVILLLLSPALIAPLACARQSATAPPIYTSTSFQEMNPDLPRDRARREALSAASLQARDRIEEQVYRMRLSDGRSLGDLAAVDPFVRAVIQDNLRAAVIADRAVSDEDVVSVTVRMELAPLYKMIEEYPRHALR
jgi:hypothetical protein